MKKFLKIFVLIIIFATYSVKAVSIKNFDIIGNEKVTVGSEFDLAFKILYSDPRSDVSGVASVIFEIDFDEKVLTVTNSKSVGFDTSIVKNDGKYYIVAVIDSNDPYNNKCSDKVLYCADYMVATLTFYVKDTNETNTKVKINNANLVLYEIGGDYQNEVVVETSLTKEYDLKIEKNINQTIEFVESNIVDSDLAKLKADIDKRIASQKKEEVKVDSSSAYLKTLKVIDHRIQFDKNTFEYKIFVDPEINSIEVNAEAESSTSKVTITGADDLKANDNKVLIEVVSKNNNKKTYTILVKEKQKTISVEEEKPTSNFKLEQKYLNIIFIGLGFIFLVIIVILIINHHENKKIDRLLNEFDKK